MSPKTWPNQPDDGHEHDFGQADYTHRLTDKTRCRLCGVTILSGFELPLEFD